MLKSCAIALLVVAGLIGAEAMAITLSQDGRSEYSITTADDASAPVLHAAKELQEHLKLATGAELPIRKLSETDASQKQILVGPSPRARELAGKVNWASLEQDGIVIKVAGDVLILAGGEPRGTIYAVNTFLEDIVGVRWWTSRDRDVPNKPTLTVSDKLNHVYVPRLRYREAFYRDFENNAEHCTRLKINGNFNAIPPELGGHYEILGWCHTFNQLIPPATYFAEHPEWFSLVDGKRVGEHAQLCLTNVEMRRELVRRALEWIAEKSNAGIISIAQNDSGGACQCGDCTAIVREEGSESGPLVRFVNAVAADIGAKYPDFLVETLAYQYTRKPPAKVKPAGNVLIRLCSIEADFVYPLSHDRNASFAADLRGWSKIAPKLFVWNYVANLGNFLIPHPNMPPLGQHLRMFVDHNVIGVFEQGDFYNPGGAGEFLDLRAWIISHLMWDPSRDQRKLRDEFLNGFYGAGGAPLASYLDLLASAAVKSEVKMGCYHNEVNYMSERQWEEAGELFDRAEKAASGDAVKLQRVQRERLLLDHVALLRFDFERRAKALSRTNPQADPAEAVCAEYTAAVDRFLAKAHDQQVHSLTEGTRFEAYEPVLRARCEEYVKQQKAGQ